MSRIIKSCLVHIRVYIYIHIIYVYIWIIVIWRYVRCFTRGLPKFLELLRTLTFPKALNSARSRVFCPNLSPMRIRNGHVHIKNVDDIEIDLRKSKLVLVPNGLRYFSFLERSSSLVFIKKLQLLQKENYCSHMHIIYIYACILFLSFDVISFYITI